MRICRMVLGLLAAAVLLGGLGGLTPAAADTTVRVLPDQSYAATGGPQRMDVYLPGHQTGPVPAIVFVHGGAWVGGDHQELAATATAAARRGYAGFVIDYHLDAPRYPREVQDVTAAVRAVRARAASYGADPNRLAGWGESAGAHLLLAAAVSGAAPLQGVVAWSGPFDLPPLLDGHYPELAGYIGGFLGCDTATAACRDRAAAASPLRNLTAVPGPTMLVNSTAELVPAGQMTALADALTARRVAVRTLLLPGDRHGIAYADDATGPALDFLDAHLR